MGGLCQRRPAVSRAFIHMKEEIPRQGRLKGCLIMCAARHLMLQWHLAHDGLCQITRVQPGIDTSADLLSTGRPSCIP